MKRALELVETLLHTICCLAIFAMMILITFDTIGRYFFNNPIQGSYEITELYLMIMVVFLTLSFTFKNGGHIRIDILYSRFSQKQKAIADMLGLLLSIIVFSIITYQSGILAYDAWSQEQYTFGVITLPMVWSYIWVPLGSGVLTLRLLLEFITTSKGLLQDHTLTNKQSEK